MEVFCLRFKHKKDFIDVSIVLFQRGEICTPSILFYIFYFLPDLAGAEGIQPVHSTMWNRQSGAECKLER